MMCWRVVEAVALMLAIADSVVYSMASEAERDHWLLWGILMWIIAVYAKLHGDRGVCDAEGPLKPTESEAIAAWNTRKGDQDG